eukprot:15357242-Ditylum_brightwellii.AAC.1
MKHTKDSSDAIEIFFRKTNSNDSGEPLNSDYEADNGTVSDLMEQQKNENEKVGGILCEKDVGIPEPSDKCSFINSTIKRKYKGIFDTGEFMTFVGIIILCTLDPTPGKELSYLFENPEKYPYTKNMKYSCFKQLKSCLHCNNNEEEGESNDYLFK